MRIRVLWLSVLLTTGRATTPVPPPPIEDAFAAFRSSMPARLVEFWEEMHRQLPGEKSDRVIELLEAMAGCAGSVRYDIVPKLERGFAEKRKLEDLVEQFELLSATMANYRWALDELLVWGLSKKVLTVDDVLFAKLQDFWRDFRRYEGWFGWNLRTEIEAKRPNKSPEPTPTAVTPPANGRKNE